VSTSNIARVNRIAAFLVVSSVAIQQETTP